MSKDSEWKIDSVPDLTKRILEIWDKKEKEALALQAEQKEKLEAEIKLESTIKTHLKNMQSIASNMEEDYLKLEVKVIAEKRKETEKGALRAEDVKSGKISMAKFLSQGKTESIIAEEVMREGVAELENGLRAIHAKNKEVLQTELSLSECQHKIRAFILGPARILAMTFKDLAEISGRETGLFEQDLSSSREAVEQIKGKLHLTEGKSLTPGYRWDSLTLEEAYKIQFNPIIPIELVPKLKSELQKFEGAETVSIAYFLKSKDIDVSSFTMPKDLERRKFNDEQRTKAKS